MSVYFLTCCNPLTPSDGHWAKPQKPRMSAHSRMLWRVNRLMVIGQRRRNPGCQSSVYMLWRVNSVWWPLGKAEKKRGCQSSVYTLWCVNSVLYGQWAKPKKPRMSVYFFYMPAPPSGTDKCVLLGCLVHFFGKRADSENNLILEHIL